MYKRVVLKISGEALGSSAAPICWTKVEETAQNIRALWEKGVQIGIVVGGGNIMRGRTVTTQDRNRVDHMGMLSTAINALALEDGLAALDVPCRVLSAVDMDRFCDPFSAREANRLLAQKTVVIFACGSGSPFFSTDTAAALRAAEVGAGALLLAKNVDAVYSDDPRTNPDAERYAHLSYDKVIADKLNATDLTAITLCREQNIPILVFALSELPRIADEKPIGTVIDAGKY
ncbi:MAG: UMP kinase [Clostridiales bacterium]|nr:UMP kinase [Clostridiales bacterium]